MNRHRLPEGMGAITWGLVLLIVVVAGMLAMIRWGCALAWILFWVIAIGFSDMRKSWDDAILKL